MHLLSTTSNTHNCLSLSVTSTEWTLLQYSTIQYTGIPWSQI